MTTNLWRAVSGCMFLLFASSAFADAKSMAAREVADYVLEKFGKQAVKERPNRWRPRLKRSQSSTATKPFWRCARLVPPPSGSPKRLVPKGPKPSG